MDIKVRQGHIKAWIKPMDIKVRLSHRPTTTCTCLYVKWVCQDWSLSIYRPRSRPILLNCRLRRGRPNKILVQCRSRPEVSPAVNIWELYLTLLHAFKQELKHFWVWSLSLWAEPICYYLIIRCTAPWNCWERLLEVVHVDVGTVRVGPTLNIINLLSPLRTRDASGAPNTRVLQRACSEKPGYVFFFFLFFVYSSQLGWDSRESPHIYIYRKAAHSSVKKAYTSEKGVRTNKKRRRTRVQTWVAR